MKVPEPKKIDKDRWFIQLRLGGKSEYVYGKTKTECKNKAALIKSEYNVGKRRIRNADTPTLTKAIDVYIEERKNTCSPSTITGYKRIQDGRFKQYMNTPIGELTDKWQAIVNEEAALDISPKTLKNAYYFIKSVYKKNGIVLPDSIKLPVEEDHTKEWLDPDQIEILVKSVTGTAWQLPVLFALHSLRRSELLALDWSNIDIENEQFDVRGAVVKNIDGNFVYKTANKNKSSQRTIPIMIPELLTALKAVPEEERTGRVITINGNSILYEVNKACAAAGVPEVGTHGLRHSFASLAYHLGMNEQETMDLGGWSDYGTMRKIYTHLSNKDKLKGINKMKAFYSKNTVENTAQET